MLYSPRLADVAQLVEQRFRNAWVGGSSPSIGTISDEDMVDLVQRAGRYFLRSCQFIVGFRDKIDHGLLANLGNYSKYGISEIDGRL